jgi:hypothetical protein
MLIMIVLVYCSLGSLFLLALCHAAQREVPSTLDDHLPLGGREGTPAGRAESQDAALPCRPCAMHCGAGTEAQP